MLSTKKETTHKFGHETGIVIDPPSGWKYGFPKLLPTNMDGIDIYDWLIENGYPKEEADKFPEGIPCRYWESVVE